MNHNFPCTPEGGKISQLNPIIDYYKSILGGIYIMQRMCVSNYCVHVNVCCDSSIVSINSHFKVHSTSTDKTKTNKHAITFYTKVYIDITSYIKIVICILLQYIRNKSRHYISPLLKRGWIWFRSLISSSRYKHQM